MRGVNFNHVKEEEKLKLLGEYLPGTTKPGL
jgi:hypothetical protein